MLGIIIKLILGGNLHDPAQIHDRDTVRHILDHAQVMGNEQVGQLFGLLQILYQVQHLRPDRYIQGRHRLIAYHKLRIQHKGPCNHDTLPLTAGELMGIAVHHVFRHSYQFHDFLYLLDPLLIGSRAKGIQGSLNQFQNRHPWV